MYAGARCTHKTPESHTILVRLVHRLQRDLIRIIFYNDWHKQRLSFPRAGSDALHTMRSIYCNALRSLQPQ